MEVSKSLLIKRGSIFCVDWEKEKNKQPNWHKISDATWICWLKRGGKVGRVGKIDGKWKFVKWEEDFQQIAEHFYHLEVSRPLEMNKVVAINQKWAKKMVDKIKIEFGANAHLECSIAHATQRSETMWEGERAREKEKRGERRNGRRVQPVRGGKLILKFIGTGINLLNTKGSFKQKFWTFDLKNEIPRMWAAGSCVSGLSRVDIRE